MTEETKPILKLFGEKAARITTKEMNLVFNELLSVFTATKNNKLKRISLNRPLTTKLDHGDVDIVVEEIPDVNTFGYILEELFYSNHLVEVNHNGPMIHCLIKSNSIKKQIQVDFILAKSEEFDSQLMYLDFSDISGILGVVSRKLKFNYGSTGFYKIHVDNKNQYHYILLTHNLKNGLKILGYDNIIEQYDLIQNIDDIVKFVSYTDLFDSSFFDLVESNHSDRKRIRAERPTAQEIKNKLINLNKKRIQMDDNFYLKSLYPDIYEKYLIECKKINEFVHVKQKYNGNWILSKFPTLKPGPQIGKIQIHLKSLYGDKIDDIEESSVINEISNFLIASGYLYV